MWRYAIGIGISRLVISSSVLTYSGKPLTESALHTTGLVIKENGAISSSVAVWYATPYLWLQALLTALLIAGKQ